MNAHTHTHKGNVPPSFPHLCAALDSVMHGKTMARKLISERHTWDNSGFNEWGTEFVSSDKVSLKK